MNCGLFDSLPKVHPIASRLRVGAKDRLSISMLFKGMCIPVSWRFSIGARILNANVFDRPARHEADALFGLVESNTNSDFMLGRANKVFISFAEWLK